ncbi:MAG TPA: hypothetical protein VF689_11515, partial [Allosphingosinicella sp.]
MTSDPRTAGADAVLAGAGLHGTAARAQDWTETPLGAPEHWPRPLRTAASIALGSNIPMMVAWG